MISTGAQVRAAGGLLGWSQEDLAREVGLALNRFDIGKSGMARRCRPSLGPEQIAITFRKAGVALRHDPAGVSVIPGVYDTKSPTMVDLESA
jgi:hypothetical protein